MFLAKNEIFSRVILTGAIGICSFIGDQGLKHGKTAATRAIFDNVTHAFVGGLTWAVILSLSKKSLIQNFSSILCSFCLSSIIDVDHFIAACNWKLSDATHLEKRPFLHCTTVPIIIWLTMNLYSSMFNQPKYSYYSWIVLASFLSHHIRDGTRRGLWFCLIGSTQPIPYYLYLTISMMLPHILHWLMMSPVQESKTPDNMILINIV
ncbi:Transmembrane protein C5orf28 [Habropoda laboriosa]|uniref:Transmembrane protein 267 n=1 Tax=Habropoda laboriosa TaxID=597456 RepID=A0A0L7R7S7_9HYME|nr:PREDICTED: transmembrane protein C5orf28 [Habropoda laboriosa]KOC66932.1 Transmembrane protein C5orf28 [Habropoda laboriosa]